jgi:hypothetical protein
MAKRILRRPDFPHAAHVIDTYSGGNCVFRSFADYLDYWDHNGCCFFDSPEVIRSIAPENSTILRDHRRPYYEAHELEFDGESWDA